MENNLELIGQTKARMLLALLFIIVTGSLLAYALIPYFNAFLGAFILYSIFNPLYEFIVNRSKIRKEWVALAIMALSIIIVILPVYFLISTIVGEVQLIIDSFINNFNFVDINTNIDYINEKLPELNINEKIVNVVSAAGTYVSGLLLSTIQNISNQLVTLTIMFFLLYYLFTSNDTKLREQLIDLIPFNKKNTEHLLHEIKIVINSTLFATLLIALIQGTILGITFYLVGIKAAALWGSITAILSFLPVVGPPFVWAPAAVYMFIQKQYVAGIVILVVGFLISNIDNLLRPLIQKKLGAMHPFISLLGIFVGLYLFGLPGIVVGPLLISIFILLVKMFNEEYIDKT